MTNKGPAITPQTNRALTPSILHASSLGQRAWSLAVTACERSGWPAGFSPPRTPPVADLSWPATCTLDWSRCRSATPSVRRSGSLWGAELARRRPGLCSIDCIYGPGQFYNLGSRRSDLDGLRGQHLDSPRLIIQQGALLLQVPSPREAIVPHRELPGLSPA
jgi:hypothetical protein